jgi:hypothetical protein
LKEKKKEQEYTQRGILSKEDVRETVSRPG